MLCARNRKKRHVFMRGYVNLGMRYMKLMHVSMMLPGLYFRYVVCVFDNPILLGA